MSLLVCEEDFRLRGKNGQLRVSFHGPAAREVDGRKVQIGDRVQLSLEGARLEDLPDATSRDVPWVAVYSERLSMKVPINYFGYRHCPTNLATVRERGRLAPN